MTEQNASNLTMNKLQEQQQLEDALKAIQSLESAVPSVLCNAKMAVQQVLNGYQRIEQRMSQIEKSQDTVFEAIEAVNGQVEYQKEQVSSLADLSQRLQLLEQRVASQGCAFQPSTCQHNPMIPSEIPSLRPLPGGSLSPPGPSHSTPAFTGEVNGLAGRSGVSTSAVMGSGLPPHPPTTRVDTTDASVRGGGQYVRSGRQEGRQRGSQMAEHIIKLNEGDSQGGLGDECIGISGAEQLPNVANPSMPPLDQTGLNVNSTPFGICSPFMGQAAMGPPPLDPPHLPGRASASFTPLCTGEVPGGLMCGDVSSKSLQFGGIVPPAIVPGQPLLHLPNLQGYGAGVSAVQQESATVHLPINGVGYYRARLMEQNRAGAGGVLHGGKHDATGWGMKRVGSAGGSVPFSADMAGVDDLDVTICDMEEQDDVNTSDEVRTELHTGTTVAFGVNGPNTMAAADGVGTDGAEVAGPSDGTGGDAAAEGSAGGTGMHHAGKKLEFADLLCYFSVGLKQASTSLRVCPTTLKRACRRHHIRRWPARTVLKLSKQLQRKGYRGQFLYTTMQQLLTAHFAKLHSIGVKGLGDIREVPDLANQVLPYSASQGNVGQALHHSLSLPNQSTSQSPLESTPPAPTIPPISSTQSPAATQVRTSSGAPSPAKLQPPVACPQGSFPLNKPTSASSTGTSEAILSRGDKSGGEPVRRDAKVVGIAGEGVGDGGQQLRNIKSLADDDPWADDALNDILNEHQQRGMGGAGGLQQQNSGIFIK